MSSLKKLLPLAALSGALLLMGGCADHPHVTENYQNNVPLTSMSVLRESRGVLKVCLHAEAFALDNGRTAIDKVANQAIANCYPEVDTFARFNAGRTNTFHGQLLLFRSGLEQAHSLAERAVREERAQAAAP